MQLGKHIECLQRRECVQVDAPQAIAQVGAIAMLSQPEFEGQLALFAGIDKVRFKRQVKPGDSLRMEVELKQVRRQTLGASRTEAVAGLD